MLDETAPPGVNYHRADFRLWLPENVKSFRAVLVLAPGSNADGRSEADDPFWRTFASRNDLALIACHFTDRPHEKEFIEHYADASRGSGQALLDALATFSRRCKRPELAHAPLLLWGMSAGGEFNYEFTAWKPERVVAFIVNKGGVYYSALLPKAARNVPGLFFIGKKDRDWRKRIVAGLFALNREAGAHWLLLEEPNVGHVVGRSKEQAALFFDAILPLRLDTPPNAASPARLKAIDETSQLFRDLTQQLQSHFPNGRNP